MCYNDLVGEDRVISKGWMSYEQPITIMGSEFKDSCSASANLREYGQTTALVEKEAATGPPD